MEVVMRQADLARELDVVDRVASKKSTIPVLGCVHLSADAEGGLTVSATDLDVSVRTGGIAASVGRPGVVVVPAATLRALVKTLGETDVSLTASDTSTVMLRAAGFRGTLQTLPLEDYPAIQARPSGAGHALTRAGLREMLRRVRFCVTGEDTRYYMNGALLEIEGSTARMVSTDGHRMSVAEMPVVAAADAPAVKAIIPRRGLDALGPMLDGEGEDPVFLQSENSLFFEVGDRLLLGRLVDGQFPAYQRVMPKPGETPAVTDRGVLLEAVRRAVLMANERSISVTVSVSSAGTGLRVESANASVGQGLEDVAVEYSGPDVRLGINGAYLVEALNAAATERIAVHMMNGEKPVLLQPVGDDTFRHVIMPMRA